MTSLIQLFLNKLYAYCDRSTFYTLSPHVVGSMVNTATQLRAQTCTDAEDRAEISDELVITILSNAVINLLRRHATPAQPDNINQRLLAAFNIVISQFYGMDTLRHQDAKQLFAGVVKIDYRVLAKLETDCCDQLKYDIGLNRDEAGELVTFPSLAMDDHARQHLNAMSELERKLLEHLFLAPGGNFNLQRHYEFVACEFWPALFQVIPQTNFLTHVANLTEADKHAMPISLLKTSPAFEKLLIQLIRLTVEKITHAYIEELSVDAPCPDYNQLPEHCLRELSTDLVERHGIHLYGSYLQQDHAGFKAYCKLILPMQVNFCYLVVLNHLRTAIWQRAVLPYFHHDRDYLERMIIKLTSNHIAKELSWEKIKTEIQALIQQTTPTQSIEELLHAYANQSCHRHPTYARLLTRGILFDFLTRIQSHLPCSHRFAERLLNQIRDRIKKEYKDVDAQIDAETNLHQHFFQLLWTHNMTQREMSKVLARAFWRAAEHEPAIGFELLVRFYIIRNYNQPNNFEQWDEQARAVHANVVHTWFQHNVKHFKFDKNTFWQVFEYHLQNPHVERDASLQNVHNHDLNALQDSLCRIWMSASIPTQMPAPEARSRMGHGR